MSFPHNDTYFIRVFLQRFVHFLCKWTLHIIISWPYMFFTLLVANNAVQVRGFQSARNIVLNVNTLYSKGFLNHTITSIHYIQSGSKSCSLCILS